MGKVVTPRYVVKFSRVVSVDGESARFVMITDAAWNCKQAGRPTDENLRKYVRDFEDSTLPGGVNEHLGVTRVGSAKIALNVGAGNTLATYEPGMFEVV